MSGEPTPSPAPRATVQHPVVVVGLGLVVVQLLVRGWALLGSWFYADDYRLLGAARGQELSAAHLVDPFDSQFMPLGRLVVWIVADNGQVNWTLAASTTLGFQLLASCLCLTMLVVLFGPRWGVLAPLSLYLFSSLTMPAFMWWAAALNQLPWQAVFFAAVTTWVLHLRTGARRWLAATVAVVLIGLAAYVKTLLVLPVLAFVLLGWFTTGGPVARVKDVVTRFWPAAVAMVLAAGSFLAFYLTSVPQVFRDTSFEELTISEVAAPLADTMLVSSLSTGLTGGPWHWLLGNPPLATADPPAVVIGMAWLVIGAVVAALVVTRRRVGRAIALVGLYALGDYVLVLTSRARVLGEYAGTEYRYLTDVVVIAALALALATMELRESRESSEPRPVPLVRRGGGRPWPLVPVAIGLSVVVALSGVVNSVTYAQIWHTDNPGADYVQTVRSLAEGRTVDLPSQQVPRTVIPLLAPPWNDTRSLLPVVAQGYRFPEHTDRLRVLDDQGELHDALINRNTVNQPGPVQGCGWSASDAGPTSIPLESTTVDYDWWIRIAYLSSDAGPVTVRAGRSTVDAVVNKGVGSLYVRVSGAIGAVDLSGLAPGHRLCVDVVEVGTPVVGEEQ